eukprot:scaffold318598_cov36-Tisochrysis_lutea.AAC.2
MAQGPEAHGVAPQYRGEGAGARGREWRRKGEVILWTAPYLNGVQCHVDDASKSLNMCNLTNYFIGMFILRLK